jgi:hypothetical protein
MPTNPLPGYKREILHLTKVGVAQSQLKTAIRLWFNDGDAASIHTLACAAYEIIHVVSKKRNRTRQLIFDTLSVKEEFRSDWARKIKEHASFFKHASHDPDGTIDFDPVLSMMFMMGAVAGMKIIEVGLPAGKEESAFMVWVALHRPTWASARARQILIDRFPVEELAHFQALPKAQFFDAFMIAKQD